MTNFEKTRLTDEGIAFLSKSGITIDFTRVETGDGRYTVGEDVTSLSALKSKKQDIQISNVYQENETSVGLEFVVSNAELAKGYLFTEIGVYANAPEKGEVLYALCYATEENAEWVRAYNGEFVSALKIKLRIQVAADSNVTYQSGGGSDITIDSFLSEKSRNPVENKVVTAEFAKVEEEVTSVEKNINEEIDEIKTGMETLKKSVSDGKTKVANAITGKGVTTATNAAFQTMADNIGRITTLSGGTADGTAQARYIVKGYTAYVSGSKIIGTLPDRSAVSGGAAGVVGLTPTTYKNVAVSPFDGAMHWAENTDGVKRFCLQAPYGVYGGKGNPGGLSGDGYVGFPVEKFGDAKPSDVIAGKTFTSRNGFAVSGTMKKCLFASPCANVGTTTPYPNRLTVVYDGKIIYLRSLNGIAGTYSFDGTTVEANPIAVPPYRYFSDGQAVVYNDEIHLLTVRKTSSNSNVFHYKWDGSAWTQVCQMSDENNLEHQHCGGDAVVYNNEIYLFGSVNIASSVARRRVSKWNGSEWVSAGAVPYSYGDIDGKATVVYGGAIHALGLYDDSDFKSTYHYKYDGSAWTQVGIPPVTMNKGTAVVYDGKIHIFPNDKTCPYGYSWDGSAWTKINGLEYGQMLNGGNVVYKDKLYTMVSQSNQIWELKTVYSNE